MNQIQSIPKTKTMFVISKFNSNEILHANNKIGNYFAVPTEKTKNEIVRYKTEAKADIKKQSFPTTTVQMYEF